MKKYAPIFFTLAFGIANFTQSEGPNQLSNEEWMKQLKKFYNNTPVLVTGGCGFIGSHLVERLIELGAQVTVMDNLSTGSLRNIQNIKDHITFINNDIGDFDACLEATQGQKIIFHQAAFVSVPKSLENPISCHNTNITGTINLLEAARQNNIERFIFASSCSVYGEQEGICSEKTATKPYSPYALTKLLGEQYCQFYTKKFDLPTVILRYFNVYGSRQSLDGAYAAAVARFAHNMENDEPITIFGDGNQTRDFVQVKNVVDANLILGMLATEKIKGEIFNIASGRSLSIHELIASMKNMFPNYAGAIMYASPRPGDVKHVAADCTKYKNVFTT